MDPIHDLTQAGSHLYEQSGGPVDAYVQEDPRFVTLRFDLSDDAHAFIRQWEQAGAGQPRRILLVE